MHALSALVPVAAATFWWVLARHNCQKNAGPNHAGFATQLPVLIFAYTCNMNVPIFYGELRAQTYESFDSKFNSKRDTCC